MSMGNRIKRKMGWLLPVFILIFPLSVHSLAPNSSFEPKKDDKGRNIVPLTAQEESRLRPRYVSMLQFWRSEADLKSMHPGIKFLYLIRHGESSSNVLTYTQLFNTYTPLTWKGSQQARVMGEFLGHRDFDSYASSDLERAHMTLLRLARKRGPETPVRIDPRLREVAAWPAGGMDVFEARTILKEEFLAFSNDPENFAIPSRRWSMRGFLGDLRKALEEFAASPDSNVAWGTHGRAIHFMILECMHIPLIKMSTSETLLPGPGNASVTVLAYLPAKRGWELIVYGDDSYLSPELRKKTEPRIAFKADHYTRALFRVALVKLGFTKPFLSDFVPSSVTFFQPSPKEIKAALLSQSLIQSSL